jgi:phosphoglycerate dehydrogenase-like enzyme
MSVEGTARPRATGVPSALPGAIALTPILSARYRPIDLERIRAAAPGSRIVLLSREGLSDEPVDDVEVLLRGWLAPDAFDRLLTRAPHLAWVHSASAGVDRILTPAARARGVTITNARDVFSQPIAEYAMTMILAIARRLPQLLELQRERTWQPLQAVELGDVTIGLVGYGSLGQTIGRLASAFGARVVATRRRAGIGDAARPSDAGGQVELLGGPGALHQLLARSDFVVLALPLTRETENLIDGAALAAMKRGAWLINVARGGLVDERALVRALNEGRIGGAVLDTFREEPLSPDSPFYDLPNVIVTPHTSWSSGRVLDRTIELFCDNLVRFAAGQPLRNVVDPAAGY